MSAGAFQLGRYEGNDNAKIYPIRVQPETIAAELGGTANAGPSGALTEEILVKVSRSSRGYGVRPRKVSFRFTGGVPAGYAAGQSYSIPVLQEATWDGVSTGATGTYLGEAIQIIGKSPESVR